MNDTPRSPPETFLLLKFGRSVYTKDGKEGGFDFDAPAAGSRGHPETRQLLRTVIRGSGGAVEGASSPLFRNHQTGPFHAAQMRLDPVRRNAQRGNQVFRRAGTRTQGFQDQFIILLHIGLSIPDLDLFLMSGDDLDRGGPADDGAGDLARVPPPSCTLGPTAALSSVQLGL